MKYKNIKYLIHFPNLDIWLVLTCLINNVPRNTSYDKIYQRKLKYRKTKKPTCKKL